MRLSDQATRGCQVLLLRSCTRERTREIPTGLTRKARWSNTTRVGLTRLTKLVRSAKIADRTSEQIGLVGLLTRKDGLWRTQLAREAGLHKARGKETRRRKSCCIKKEASSVVVPERYYQDKNVGCRSYGKKSWPKRKRGRIGTISLTILDP
jgi:hypothetical protein